MPNSQSPDPEPTNPKPISTPLQPTKLWVNWPSYILSILAAGGIGAEVGHFPLSAPPPSAPAPQVIIVETGRDKPEIFQVPSQFSNQQLSASAMNTVWELAEKMDKEDQKEIRDRFLEELHHLLEQSKMTNLPTVTHY